MICYPSVNLPDSFTRLLRTNLQKPDVIAAYIKHEMEEDQGLRSLVYRFFKDIDPKVRIEFIIKSVGWHGFRDRLASLYLYYKTHRDWPNETDQTMVSDLVEIEQKLKRATVDGFSRGFMLAFYFKMAGLSLSGDNNEGALNYLTIEDEIIDLLKSVKSRTVKIDWLVILMNHFDYFLGREKLKDSIKNGLGYEEIYKSLDPDFHSILMENNLTYGYSVNDPEFFYVETV